MSTAAKKAKGLPAIFAAADSNPAPDAKEGEHTSPNAANPPGHTVASLNPAAQVEPPANLNPLSNGYGNTTLIPDAEDFEDKAFAPVDKESGEVWLRATRDNMYDSDAGLYFFTNKATRVTLPASPWLKMQVEAKLICHATKDYKPSDDAPTPESFNK